MDLAHLTALVASPSHPDAGLTSRPADLTAGDSPACSQWHSLPLEEEA